MWYYLFKYIFMGPLFTLLGRPKVEGLEYIPSSGPAILASNHLAVADSFYLPLVVRRRIWFLAKSEYFTGTGLKGWINRWFYSVSARFPSTAPMPTPRRAHCRRQWCCWVRASCWACIQKALARRTVGSTKARPA